jgi:hypothetical protein
MITARRHDRRFIPHVDRRRVFRTGLGSERASAFRTEARSTGVLACSKKPFSVCEPALNSL